MSGRVNRWFLYGPFIIAGFLVLGWFASWRAGAALMRENLDGFATAGAAEGYAIAFAPMRVRGFPFFLRGVASDFLITRGDQQYDCSLLYLDAIPYALDRIIFSCGGAQSYAAQGREWTIDAKDAKMSLERDKRRGWIMKMQSGGAAIVSEGQSISIDAAVLNLAPTARGNENIDASLRVTGVRAQAKAGDYAIERFDAAITISTVDSSGRLKIAVHGVEALLGETKLAAKGFLEIPADGEASGRLNARIEKPAGLAQALAAAGLIEKKDAQIADAGLAMLSIAAGGVVTAPIDYANNEVRIAGIKLAQIKKRAQP